MEASQVEEVTLLLARWSQGDGDAFNRAVDVILPEMRKVAGGLISRERSDITLQATALVNEAYLRLAKQKGFQFDNRYHFYALCAHVMRRVLVDHARASKAKKRGSGAQKVSLEDITAYSENGVEQFLVLQEALDELGKLSETKVRLIELRYFAGLTIEECAEALHLSATSTYREQRLAEAWLMDRLTSKAPR